MDDVLTRGSTMLGCATRLREFYPDVPLAGFAVARTRSDECEITTPIAPRLYRVIRWGEADSNVVESGESIA